jgi:hypothetical protein
VASVTAVARTARSESIIGSFAFLRRSV